MLGQAARMARSRVAGAAPGAGQRTLERLLHRSSLLQEKGTPSLGPAEGGGSEGTPLPGSYVASPITLDSVSPLVRECEYAVRGAIVARAQALEEQLNQDPGSVPFPSVVYCNIGNPQALGQPPISFFREVLALCDHPVLCDYATLPVAASAAAPAAASTTAAAGGGGGGGGKGGAGAAAAAVGLFPFSATAQSRAQRLLRSLPSHATGAYSHSKGIPLCRADVAAGISSRDGGHVSDPESIFLTDGASPAAQMIMRLLVRSPADGVMCPIPQYPLYSATLALLGGTLVPYFLHEDPTEGCWHLKTNELESQLAQAVAGGVIPRALVVINPGNPTGQVLEVQEQKAIVEFCRRHHLLLLADEVYQENVYAPNRRFTSFKKVARDMGVGPDDLALVSIHSASKGFYGECGRRGGYMEVTGLPADVVDQLYKLASVTLCSNVSGQILCSLIMQPPKPGDDAHPLFVEERSALLSSLAKRAEYIVEHLNSVEGVSCCATEGAMYAFPRLHLPPRALAAAAAAGVKADTFYAQRLLDATGIVVVPGSGFGQKPGTWHLRFTILPPEGELPGMMERFSAFHASFMEEFR